MELTPVSIMAAIVFVAGGLALLAAGGEILVRAAINAARLLRISPVVIGLTVVAFATSLPELAVSLTAAFRGSPDVAIGNVVGSNMFNIAVIIGLSTLLFPPLQFSSPKIRLDIGVMAAASIALIVMGWNGWLGTLEGVVFIAGLVAFLWMRVRGAQAVGDEALETAAEVAIQPHGKKRRGVVVSVLFIFAGAALLTGGAEALVRGAIFIAREKGISERVIAITLVSAGTGLPEFATSVVAGIRRHTSVAIGNVIGSNIFNVLGILGTVSLVRPIPAPPRLIHHDALWMLGISMFVLLPVVKPGRTMSRLEGAVLLAVYTGYVVWLFRY
jgi:cation:H+ antiporter